MVKQNINPTTTACGRTSLLLRKSQRCLTGQHHLSISSSSSSASSTWVSRETYDSVSHFLACTFTNPRWHFPRSSNPSLQRQSFWRFSHVSYLSQGWIHLVTSLRQSGLSPRALGAWGKSRFCSSWTPPLCLTAEKTSPHQGPIGYSQRLSASRLSANILFNTRHHRQVEHWELTK